MKRLKLLILFSGLLITFDLVGQTSKFFLGYQLKESNVTEYKDGYFGKAIVYLDSIHRCHVMYGIGTPAENTNYKQHLKAVEWITRLTSSQSAIIYHGKSSDGTYFAEKILYNRPCKERLLFYQIPERYYSELLTRLNKVSYLPLELFRDSLITLMGYKLTGAFWDSYEEGRDGGALINIDYGKSCLAYYFNGAMMSIPLYPHHIEKIEYVNRIDSSQNDNMYSSHTGIIYYGKAADGTYFVEKQFYHDLQGLLPQGIILYQIPAECYENVLMQLCSLPDLLIEMFGIGWPNIATQDIREVNINHHGNN